MFTIRCSIFPFLYNIYNNTPYFIFSDNLSNINCPCNIYPCIRNQSFDAFCCICDNVAIYILNTSHGTYY